MGNYSLDAFERYPLVKLRPVMAEPARQCYRLLEPEAEGWPKDWDGDVLLRLPLEKAAGVFEACDMVRKLGTRWNSKLLSGVVMDGGAFSGESLISLAQAYRESFAETVLLVQPDTEMADVCHRENIQTGLWLPLSQGILPLRRAVAEHSLARNWERYPVYFFANRELTEEERDAVRRWHVSGGDCPGPYGARMTLRRMMFPRDLSSGGAMPLRMWWQNLGTAPLYREAHVRLELGSGSERFPILLPAPMPAPGLGDSTLNVTAQLPEVPPGTYALWCGLESGGKRLPLAIAGPSKEGMYQIGELTLDEVSRPYLAAMWEEQYADGYYPLEDPQQPE